MVKKKRRKASAFQDVEGEGEKRGFLMEKMSDRLM